MNAFHLASCLLDESLYRTACRVVCQEGERLDYTNETASSSWCPPFLASFRFRKPNFLLSITEQQLVSFCSLFPEKKKVQFSISLCKTPYIASNRYAYIEFLQAFFRVNKKRDNNRFRVDWGIKWIFWTWSVVGVIKCCYYEYVEVVFWEMESWK